MDACHSPGSPDCSLAGAVGAALRRRAFELRRVERIGTGRALRTTPAGRRELRELLGIEVPV